MKAKNKGKTSRLVVVPKAIQLPNFEALFGELASANRPYDRKAYEVASNRLMSAISLLIRIIDKLAEPEDVYFQLREYFYTLAEQLDSLDGYMIRFQTEDTASFLNRVLKDLESISKGLKYGGESENDWLRRKAHDVNVVLMLMDEKGQSNTPRFRFLLRELASLTSGLGVSSVKNKSLSISSANAIARVSIL